MARGITHLRQVGITEVCANVSYHGEEIMAFFGDGAAYGVQMHWLQEQTLTGTAGGLKGMEPFLAGDEVIVIAGDAMLDVDLTPLLAAHRANGAFATLATLRVADPAQYGVVVTDDAHRVVSFQEKPEPGTEISHDANTGIYIFDPGIFALIPSGTEFDFARNVFPEILRQRLPFYALPVQGYWTDIGNPGDYLQANLNYLDGRIRVEGRGDRVGSNLLDAGAVVAGAHLTRTTVGARAVLAPGTTLHECVVWPDVVIPAPLTAVSAVFTPWGAYTVNGLETREIE